MYVLKDDLKALWEYRHEGYARRFWSGWYRRAIRSRIAPLQAFARRLRLYLPGVLAHCRYPLNTSLLEGINNKIKVIKRSSAGIWARVCGTSFVWIRVLAASGRSCSLRILS